MSSQGCLPVLSSTEGEYGELSMIWLFETSWGFLKVISIPCRPIICTCPRKAKFYPRRLHIYQTTLEYWWWTFAHPHHGSISSFASNPNDFRHTASSTCGNNWWHSPSFPTSSREKSLFRSCRIGRWPSQIHQHSSSPFLPPMWFNPWSISNLHSCSPFSLNHGNSFCKDQLASAISFDTVEFWPVCTFTKRMLRVSDKRFWSSPGVSRDDAKGDSRLA